MRLGYARLSTQGQRVEGLTLEAQIDQLNAAQCDLIYQDIQSGRNPGREQFQKLIEDALRYTAEGFSVEIVFPRLDRWSRDVVSSMSRIEELEKAGVKIRSLETGQISVASADGWLSTINQSIYAEYYSRRLSSNISKSYDRKRRTGKPVQTRPPWGWKLNADKSGFQPDITEWGDTGKSAYELARALVDLYLSGKSMYECCQQAIEWGRSFQGSSFSRWLDNPIHRGHLWYYTNPEGRVRRHNQDRTLIYNQHPPLFTEDEYRLILRRKEEGKRLWGKNAKAPINKLSGLCWCVHCGTRMSRNLSKDKRGLWMGMRCRKNGCPAGTISYAKIEQALIEAICAKAEAVAEQVMMPSELSNNPELLQLQQQRAELIELAEKTGLSSLDTAIDELSVKINQLQGVKVEPDSILKAKLIQVADPELFQEINDRQLKNVYQDLCDRIDVDTIGKNIEVRLKI